MIYKVRCHRCDRPIDWVWRVFVDNECWYLGRGCYRIVTAALTLDGVRWSS